MLTTKRTLALAIASTFAVASLSHAQSSSMAMSPKATFVHKAAQGGIAEVELSKLAATQGASNEVKKFAAKMIDAHTANNQKLTDIAQGEGIAVPAETDVDHLTLKTKLSASKGAEFDRVYVQAMRRDHTDMLNLLDGAKSLGDPKLEAFAKETRPVVADHLKMANALTGG